MFSRDEDAVAAWNQRAINDQTEALAQWMHERGLATGHGDDVPALLRELAREWNSRAPALRWRSEPPDVPGWWLIYERDGESRVVRVVDPAYYSTTEARERAAVYGWRWLGPIPEPEEAE